MFRALIVDKDEDSFSVEIRDLTEDDLPEGDVLIDVEYSTINYKDALAITDVGTDSREVSSAPLETSSICTSSGTRRSQPTAIARRWA